MNKRNSGLKISAVVILVAAIIGAAVFYKIWYQPHRDVKDEKGIQVAAQDIMTAYAANEKTANTLYLDKAIQVTGEVSELTKNEAGKTIVTLKTSDPMGGVRCTMKEDTGNIKPGSAVIIKGICTGYLMDVTLIECYLVQ